MQGVLTGQGWEKGRHMLRQLTSQTDSIVVTPGPAEPLDREARTFADVEGGEPDPLIEEMALDAAIL